MEKRYALIFKFHKDTNAPDRTQRITKLAKYLADISERNKPTFFTEGVITVFFYKTAKSAAHVYDDLRRMENNTGTLINEDHLLILEIGDDFFESGFSGIRPWLQRR